MGFLGFLWQTWDHLVPGSFGFSVLSHRRFPRLVPWLIPWLVPHWPISMPTNNPRLLLLLQTPSHFRRGLWTPMAGLDARIYYMPADMPADVPANALVEPCLHCSEAVSGEFRSLQRVEGGKPVAPPAGCVSGGSTPGPLACYIFGAVKMSAVWTADACRYSAYVHSKQQGYVIRMYAFLSWTWQTHLSSVSGSMAVEVAFTQSTHCVRSTE